MGTDRHELITTGQGLLESGLSFAKFDDLIFKLGFLVIKLEENSYFTDYYLGR